jgi:hypothetical protein
MKEGAYRPQTNQIEQTQRHQEGGNGSPGLPLTIHERANPPPESARENRIFPSVEQNGSSKRDLEHRLLHTITAFVDKDDRETLARLKEARETDKSLRQVLDEWLPFGLGRLLSVASRYLTEYPFLADDRETLARLKEADEDPLPTDPLTPDEQAKQTASQRLLAMAGIPCAIPLSSEDWRDHRRRTDRRFRDILEQAAAERLTHRPTTGGQLPSPEGNT